MMNSNSTPKIVVGIGLAVVFGVGVSVFAVRAKQESEQVRTAPAPALAAPSDQNGADATATAPNAAAPTDQSAPSSSTSPAVPSVVAPTPVAPSPAAPPTSSNLRKDSADRHVAGTRNSSSPPDIRVASAAPAEASVDAQQAAAPADSDSQITAAVKSEIASAAPGSNVDVTTSNGVVALAGSVPSEDNVDQARQAAQRIPGVKHVDAGALTVSNQ